MATFKEEVDKADNTIAKMKVLEYLTDIKSWAIREDNKINAEGIDEYGYIAAESRSLTLKDCQNEINQLIERLKQD